jgi:hypothetical protein
MTNIEMTKGDTLPVVTATLRDRSGVVNLTNATVRFVSTMGIDQACTVTNAAGGIVTWTPTGLTLKAGSWISRFVVTFQSGAILSFPNAEPYLFLQVYDQG